MRSLELGLGKTLLGCVELFIDSLPGFLLLDAPSISSNICLQESFLKEDAVLLRSKVVEFFHFLVCISCSLPQSANQSQMELPAYINIICRLLTLFDSPDIFFPSA